MSLYSLIAVMSRFLGRLTEYHLHQLQPSPASSSQLLERCSGGEMSLLGVAHPEGELVVNCHQ